MKVLRLIPLAFALLLAASPAARGDQDPVEAARPHPLPVFRSVLDGNPRMITIPLHADMWLAYDARTCHLYKAWTGGVKLDGAVYTKVHGPQPTSRGAPYFTSTGSTWRSCDGSALTPSFLGYRIGADHAVTLRYVLRTGCACYVVEETPRFVRRADGAPELRRSIEFDRPPPRGAFLLHVPLDNVLEHRIDGLRHATERGKWVSFTTNPGYRIMAMSLVLDKASAVRQAAARAAAAKAKAGTVPADEPAPAPVKAHPTDTPVGNGVSVRVYWIGASMSRLPALVSGQTPNVSHVLPVLDLRSERKDFGEISDAFLTHVDGFLEITEPGTYAFRLLSDDGSRFSLDDEVVVDHDGLHGVTAMEGKATLTKGRHKLFVEHFENGGGEQLTLEWMPPGASAWTVVPNTALRAPKGEVRVTSPGKKKIESARPTGAPGDGRPLDGVHPAFDLSQARPDWFKPRVGGMDWLPDGRLVICCWEPDGGVYALDGVGGSDPSKIRVTRIAAGLAEPLGLRVVNRRLYVLQKQELTELVDRDRDGRIDEYRTVAAGWGVTANFHEFAFGLVHNRGHFYATLATAIDPGGASTQPQNPDRGKVVKISPGGRYEFVAHGLRTPNGIGLGVDREIFVTDNQGDWLPVSKLVHVRPGAFFGSRSVDFEGTKDLTVQPPVVWLPQGEIGNSPGEPGLLCDGPYCGQMLHADVTHGGLKRVFVEKVGGQYQGCVFRFTQGLEAGINRWTRGRDGAMYLGGIGSSGNWGQTGKLAYGLQRLKYNGRSVFEMLRVRAMPETRGFVIEFTEPLARVAGGRRGDYELRQWRYEPTKSYGGPKKDVEPVEVTGVAVARDRRSVFVETTGLKEGRVVHIRLGRTIRNARGARPWSPEAWYTLNRTGTSRADAGRLPPDPPHNVLSRAEADAGFELLFDGSSLDHWRGYKQDGVPPSWVAEEGALHLSRRGKGGDLITRRQYDDFELKLEWKISKGGNSGICYRLTEAADAMWLTGAEMQVLDNEAYGKLSPKNAAGGNYDLHGPRFDVTRPAGQWNQVRILAKGTHVEHWLNGWKVVEYDVGSEDWKERLAKSKFAKTEGFGVQPAGHVGLQDHGHEVWYRNIRIREIGE